MLTNDAPEFINVEKIPPANVRKSCQHPNFFLTLQWDIRVPQKVGTLGSTPSELQNVEVFVACCNCIQIAKRQFYIAILHKSIPLRSDCGFLGYQSTSMTGSGSDKIFHWRDWTTIVPVASPTRLTMRSFAGWDLGGFTSFFFGTLTDTLSNISH